MASETQNNELETQLVKDEAPLELKDGLGTSLIPKRANGVLVVWSHKYNKLDLAQERLSQGAWRTSERGFK
ncbi:Hypothetical predicted protein [Paramuricea clavata]|uniref:Uncharacterized protein n=1 Tax=Paramuricea clavata TaxID=317549 RepID=A0A7D9D991_PARCT|nr:Hypothetical predicted protein [Paramuricea clavata]